MEIALTVIFAIVFFPVAIYAFHLSNRNYSLRRRVKDVMHQKAEINNFLNLFSKSLSTVEEIDNSMNLTARYIADSVEAESVCIFETDGQFLRGIGVCGVFPLPNTSTQYAMTKPKFILDTLKRERIAIGTGFIGKVAATQQALYVEDTSDDDLMHSYSSFTRIQTVMAIPMIREGKSCGVIVAVNTRTGLPFSPEQFARFKFMAGQVMLAQDMVHVYANLAEQQRIEQELEFARQIQASLLPQAFPAWGQFAVHSQTRSSKEVNGDFYDFVTIDEDRLLIVNGDACGKGIPACMITAMTRSFIRAAAEHFTTLENMLKELNNNLFRDTDEERFVTLGCCLIDKKASIVEYARAGHTELLTFVRGHIRKIMPEGTGLGLLPRELASFDTITFQFTKGMTLLLFTDGITEALSEENEEFGIDRLLKKYESLCIDNEPLNSITNKLLETVDAFTNGASQLDDQTLVSIRHI
jgi:phosphoserine phosphatase RsbU/P